MNPRKTPELTIPIDWLAPGERDVWERRAAGMSNKEIAAELHITVQNVSVRMSYARRRILNGGPPSSGGHGRMSLEHEARMDEKLRFGDPCRCGLRGEHVCLFASGWDRRPPEWAQTPHD